LQILHVKTLSLVGSRVAAVMMLVLLLVSMEPGDELDVGGEIEPKTVASSVGFLFVFFRSPVVVDTMWLLLLLLWVIVLLLLLFKNLVRGESGDVGGGELPDLWLSGGVIGQPGGKNGVCMVDASWARSWSGHAAIKAAAAAVWFARSCGASRERADGLKQA
jgi:hypothetical protein